MPSQLGNQIVEDVCKKPAKLQGCCCSSAVEALWHLQLPVSIRAHVSNMDFNHATFKDVFEAADKVFMYAKQVSVAQLSVAAASLDETLPAFSTQNQPAAEVAAVATKNKNGVGKGSGRGNKKNKNQNQRSRGQKHSSVPEAQAEKMCDRHYVHGDQAWYCLAPTSCPWVNKCVKRP